MDSGDGSGGFSFSAQQVAEEGAATECTEWGKICCCMGGGGTKEAFSYHIKAVAGRFSIGAVGGFLMFLRSTAAMRENRLT